MGVGLQTEQEPFPRLGTVLIGNCGPGEERLGGSVATDKGGRLDSPEVVTDDDLARGYDREWTARVGQSIRRRFGYSHDHGEVTRFVLQLEYHHGNEWMPVVRYDHDEVGDHGGHDVTNEGLHIDVYRDGEKYEQQFIAPPMDVGVAIDLAEDHLRENAPRFVKRFEQWHGIQNR